MRLSAVIFGFVLFIAETSLAPRVVAQAASTPSTLTSVQMRTDLLYLRDKWALLDKSFSPEERKAFVGIVNDALSRADTLTPADFALEIARAVAVSRNGHTYATLGPWFHALPIKAAWFVDGLYIVRAHPQFPELLGARIEQIGRLTPNQALTRVAPFISGTDQRVRELSPTFLRLLEVLHRIGATPTGTKAVLTVRQRDGRRRVVTLTAEPSPDPDSGAEWLTLIPTDMNVAGRWLHVLDTLPARPTAYQRPADLSREWLGEGGRVLYVRSNWIWGYVACRSRDYLSSACGPYRNENRYGLMDKLIGLLQNEVVPRRPRHAIVDLRLNSGGDFFNTLIFAQALPKLILPEGKVFVLVGPNTFSAALVTAAMLKGYGGNRVLLVGATMGDQQPFWSEGQPQRLPNSHIMVGAAGWMHNWSDGCDDRDRCYWSNIVLGIKDVPLEPEIRVASTFGDYATGQDPVLKAALAMAE